MINVFHESHDLGIIYSLDVMNGVLVCFGRLEKFNIKLEIERYFPVSASYSVFTHQNMLLFLTRHFVVDVITKATNEM